MLIIDAQIHLGGSGETTLPLRQACASKRLDGPFCAQASSEVVA